MPTKTHEFTGVFAELLEEVGPVAPFVLTDHIKLAMPTREQMRQFYDSDDTEDKTRVLIGDQFDTIVELFNDKPYTMWNRFIEMFTEYVFGKGADKVEGN